MIGKKSQTKLNISIKNNVLEKIGNSAVCTIWKDKTTEIDINVGLSQNWKQIKQIKSSEACSLFFFYF